MRNVTIDIRGEQVPGIIAIPPSGSGPAVIVVQEWWGLVPHIQNLVGRLAEEGFVALAVDHYRGAETTEPDEARKLMLGLDIAQVAVDLAAAAETLLARDEVEGDDVRVVGFCMGGGLALMTALADAGVGKVGAAVPFYGQPLSPEQAAQVQAPILGLYGADDGGIPVAAVQAMQDALTAAGVDNEFQIYAGAPHAFFNDTRASYRPEAAADAWARMLAWFEEYL